MWFLFPKLIPVGVWYEEAGGIIYDNLRENLDKHCGVDCEHIPYESSEGYASETKTVGQTALETLMEAWNKGTHGEQLIVPVCTSYFQLPCLFFFCLTCAQEETDGEKRMERTLTEETLEGNKKTSSVLSDAP